MKIVTSANKRYSAAILPYLESLNKYSALDNVLVQVGDIWGVNLTDVRAVHLPRELNGGAPGETECCQHGSFLQVLDGDKDETIIYTDGDMVLQRPFTARELDWLENFPADTIAAGLNSGAHESLFVQGTMIQPLVDMAVVQKRYGAVLQRGMGFNVGVFVARRSTYQRLYDLYMTQWDEVGGYFQHPARQQWLMNLVIAENFRAQLTPYSFHANGHFGVPPGVIYADGLVYAGADVVAFRHKL